MGLFGRGKGGGMMNALNNLHKKFSMQKKINQTMAKELLQQHVRTVLGMAVHCE